MALCMLAHVGTTFPSAVLPEDVYSLSIQCTDSVLILLMRLVVPPSDAQKIQTDDKDRAAEATVAIDSSMITQCFFFFFKFNYQIFIRKKN